MVTFVNHSSDITSDYPNLIVRSNPGSLVANSCATEFYPSNSSDIGTQNFYDVIEDGSVSDSTGELIPRSNGEPAFWKLKLIS